MMSCTESAGSAAGETKAIGSCSTSPIIRMRWPSDGSPRSSMRAAKVGVTTQPIVAPSGAAAPSAVSIVRPASPGM
jgi:hypothetical protein